MLLYSLDGYFVVDLSTVPFVFYNIDDVETIYWIKDKYISTYVKVIIKKQIYTKQNIILDTGWIIK